MYSAWSIVSSHKIKNTSFTLTGYSISTVRTAFYIDGLKLMLDCGLPFNVNSEYVLITHGHSDHFYEVARVPDNCKKIIVPIEIKDKINEFLNLVRDINASECVIKDDFVMGLRPNEIFNLNGKKYFVETIKCYHSIPTIGYGIYQKVSKLKPEYK